MAHRIMVMIRPPHFSDDAFRDTASVENIKCHGRRIMLLIRDHGALAPG